MRRFHKTLKVFLYDIKIKGLKSLLIYKDKDIDLSLQHDFMTYIFTQSRSQKQTSYKKIITK